LVGLDWIFALPIADPVYSSGGEGTLGTHYATHDATHDATPLNQGHELHDISSTLPTLVVLFIGIRTLLWMPQLGVLWMPQTGRFLLHTA
jgi:hypothetical protein